MPMLPRLSTTIVHSTQMLKPMCSANIESMRFLRAIFSPVAAQNSSLSGSQWSIHRPLRVGAGADLVSIDVVMGPSKRCPTSGGLPVREGRAYARSPRSRRHGGEGKRCGNVDERDNSDAVRRALMHEKRSGAAGREHSVGHVTAGPR